MKPVDLKSHIQFSPAKPNRKDLLKSSKLNIKLHCLDEGQTLESSSCNETVIWVCVGGNGFFTNNSREVPVGYGTMLVCEYSSSCSAQGTERMVILEISIRGLLSF